MEDRMARPKPRSRTDRWQDAVTNAKAAYEELKAKVEEHREKLASEIAQKEEDLKDAATTIQEACQQECGPLVEKLDSAFADLKDIQSEYDDWGEQKAEATRDKLETVQGFDFDVGTEITTSVAVSTEAEIEIDLDAIESVLEEAETAELPLGFGRD
jgi:hypothetical protein